MHVMDNYNISDRFELLIFETAEEYIERKAKELEEREVENLAYKKEVEKKQGYKCDCGGEHPRWVYNDEFYICAECFMHDLQCQAEIQVPSYSVDQMDAYTEYTCWEDYWEEENNILDKVE